jgi:hypothetical protein
MLTYNLSKGEYPTKEDQDYMVGKIIKCQVYPSSVDIAKSAKANGYPLDTPELLTTEPEKLLKIPETSVLWLFVVGCGTSAFSRTSIMQAFRDFSASYGFNHKNPLTDEYLHHVYGVKLARSNNDSDDSEIHIPDPEKSNDATYIFGRLKFIQVIENLEELPSDILVSAPAIIEEARIRYKTFRRAFPAICEDYCYERITKAS